MDRAVGFLRVSREAQDDQRQRELIVDYCLKNGYEYLAEKEITEKISATVKDRSGINKLRALTNKDCDIIIITETSRLSREEDYLKLLNIVNEVLENNIDVLFIDGEKKYEKGKSLSLFEIIQLSFEAKANAEERNRTAKRLITGRVSKTRQGCFVGHQIAFGYKVIPNPLKVKNESQYGASLYVIDETKRPDVKLIFDLIANKGFTIRGTAKYLNSINVERGKGKKWTSNTINCIIHNRLYIGEYSFRGVVTNVEPIIGVELFDKAQLQLKNNYLFKGFVRKNYYIFKGIAKCHCGSSLVQQRQNEKTFTLRCLNKRSGFSMKECYSYGIEREFLNSIVWTVLKSYLNHHDFEHRTLAQRKEVSNNIEEKSEQIKNRRDHISIIEKQINNYIESLAEVKSKQTVQRINQKIENLESDIALAKGAIKELSKELGNLNKLLNTLTNSFDKKTLENITEEEKRTIYLNHIEKIVYYSVGIYNGFIVIYYKGGKGREIVLTQVNPRYRKAYHYLLDNGVSQLTKKMADNFIEKLNSDEREINPLSFVPGGYHDGTFKDYFKTDQAKSLEIPLK